MLPLILIHFIAGAILARYYRVFILIPATLISAGLMIYIQHGSNTSLFAMLMTGIISSTGLQAGYLCGLFAYAKMHGPKPVELLTYEGGNHPSQLDPSHIKAT
jgi:hypothetical protein